MCVEKLPPNVICLSDFDFPLISPPSESSFLNHALTDNPCEGRGRLSRVTTGGRASPKINDLDSIRCCCLRSSSALNFLLRTPCLTN